jgi:hypothetical protein
MTTKLSGLIGIVAQETYADGPFKGQGEHQNSLRQLTFSSGNPSNCWPRIMLLRFYGMNLAARTTDRTFPKLENM